MANENLGPAETVIATLIAYTDHLWHGRPGVVSPDARMRAGVRWDYATSREKCLAHPEAQVSKDKETGALKCRECQAVVSGNGNWIAYRLADKVRGHGKQTEALVGRIREDGAVVSLQGGAVLGRYAQPGIFPEVAAWMYREVAKVWQLDNEFAARWASHAFGEKHRDLKVVLAAFMLVQSRKGDPVMDAGKLAFHDEDFRDVGEAMCLIPKSKKKGEEERSIDPKMLLRIHELLTLPQVAEINRELGFGRSARKPFLGRWTKAVEKWLLFREENPKVLAGLVKEGYKSTVRELAERTSYRPQSERFYEALGWRQKQAKDGRRTLAIGRADIGGGESWDGLSEEQVCERIVRERPGYKRLSGLVPKEIGITRAVMMAALEAGSLSDKDVVIVAPTLEELGLLAVQDVRDRLDRAVRAADDMRAANIATRMKQQENREKLEQGADVAVQKAVEEAVRGLVVYFMVDISGSMEPAIEAAKSYSSKLVPAFPEDKLHVSVFNAAGRRVTFRERSAVGAQHAFRGISAGGGTDYSAGFRVLADTRPPADEDALFIYVGDEVHLGVVPTRPFTDAVRASGLNPVAFGLIPVTGNQGRGDAVRRTAAELGVPCFEIEEATFSDVYAIPRVLRNLIASTPVRAPTAAAPTQSRRVTLVDQILKTDLLRKPAWAA